MSSKPTISICIPTFNRAALLDQALQSVVSQTIKPFEVLIVDNASTDETAKVVKKYASYKFRYIKNKENIGMVENWNKCVQEAKGEYISFLHSDDLICPTWYENWLEVLQKNILFYTSSITIINDLNKPLYTCHTFNGSKLIKNKNVFKEFWLHLSPGIAPTAASLYHKSIFKEVGLFDARKKTEADVLHFLKIFSTYDVFYLDKIQFAYRSHASQGFDIKTQKKTLDRELQRLQNYFDILHKYYQQYCKHHPNSRFFIQYPVFMTLCPTNLYIVKFQFKKIIEYYRTAFHYFPDLFRTISDWSVFTKVQLRFIQRALFDRFIPQEDKNQLSWLQNIKKQKI